MNSLSCGSRFFGHCRSPFSLRKPLIQPRPLSPLRTPYLAASAGEQTSNVAKSGWTIQTGLALAAFIFSGVSNRVTYKMTLVPMKEYIFFLAQLLSLVYVAVYTPVLYSRYRQGRVTKEMLGVPKYYFLLTGMCEATASLLMLICAARLPGIILPILTQLMTIWQVILSFLILGRRYAKVKLIGVLFVVVGSILTATATVTSSGSGQPASIFYMMLMNVVFVLYSLSAVTKEKIFEDCKQRLGGQQLDIFVVNTFGSWSQVFCTACLFPFLLKARNMAFQDLPRYFVLGANCFCGNSLSPTSDCTGAPLLPLLYIAFNLMLNVSVLYLVRSVGTVVTSIAGAFVVPATILVFSLPLPFLGPGSALSLKFLTGCAILVIGMLLYSSGDNVQQLQRIQKTKE